MLTKVEDAQPAAGGGGGRRLLWLAAALVAVIALLAAAWLAGRSSAPAARPAPGSSGGPAPVSAVPAPPTIAAGQLRDTSQTPPTTTPLNIDWRWTDGIWLPFSQPSSPNFAGPALVAGPVASGYAHTPLGALLAAEQIAARTVAMPGGGWRAAVAAGVVPDAGRDAYVRSRASVDDSPPAGGYAQSAGFQFVDYNPSAAVMQLVYRDPAGQLVVDTATVRWQGGEGGDWRLQLQPNGADSPVAQPVGTLTGYVSFGQV